MPQHRNSKTVFTFRAVRSGVLTRNHFLGDAKSRFTLAVSAVMLFMFSQMLFSCVNLTEVKASAVSDGALYRTWQRTDQPVKDGTVSRTWIWGPQPNWSGYEPYQQSPGGLRQVVYFDKSRMEVNYPDADPSNKWYVTNGLLVKEMISGQIQVGDAQFVPYTPAEQVIAGDPVSVNPNAPTYRSLKSLASLDNDNRAIDRTGKMVTEQVYKAGTYDADSAFGKYNVAYAYYEPTLGHNIPNVFMQFFAQQGPVIENNKLTTGVVFDWIYAAGLPLTEPYWAKVKVGGADKDVLVQAFERRVITYTPSNDAQWRVEMGNVGQHYFAWRYPTGPGSDVANPKGPGLVPGAPPSYNNPGGTTTPGGTVPGGTVPGGTTTPGGSTTPTTGPTNTVSPGGPPSGTPTAGPGNCTDGNTNPLIDVAANVNGPVILPLGASAAATVNLGSVNCFAGPVNLSIDGQVAGLGASLSASTVNLTAGGSATADVKLNTADLNLLKTGNTGLTLKVSANNGQINHSIPLGIQVLASTGDFGISLDGPITLNLGGTSSVTLHVKGFNGFSGLVDLALDGQIAGLNASLSATTVNLPANGIADVKLTVSTGGALVPGNLGLTVKAKAGALNHAIGLSVLVLALPLLPTNPVTTTPVAGNPGNPTVTVPGVPTVTVPGVPTVTVPALPTVTIPALPTVTIPALPTVTIPALPTVTLPALPTVALPTITLPALPTVTIPPLPTLPPLNNDSKDN